MEKMMQASLDKLKNMPGFGTRFFTALDVVKIMEAKKGEEINCVICMCELIDDLATWNEREITEFDQKQKRKEEPVKVVGLPKCKGHLFHADCLQ